MKQIKSLKEDDAQIPRERNVLATLLTFYYHDFALVKTLSPLKASPESEDTAPHPKLHSPTH
jgi:hypothetical protein